MTPAVPLSEIGRCTGRFYLDEARPLIAMRCYFDGSEGSDDGGAKWLTLAGYIASDGFWGRFQGKWETMLKERYPIAPYIHMNPLVMHEDPFERVVGWTNGKMTELVTDAIMVLNGLDKEEFCSFACSIDLNAHKRLIAEGVKMPSEPIEILTHACVLGAFTWYFRNRPGKMEMAYIFFDQGEPFLEIIRKIWMGKSAPGRVTVEPIWGLIAGVQPMDMRNTPPIQAADMLAWARTRSLSSKKRLYQHLDKIISTVIPQDSVRLGEEKMRELAKGNA